MKFYMKSKWLLFALFFPCLLAAQGHFTADSIPMQDGQVRFSTEFNDLPLTADDIRKRVTMYVSTRLNAHDGRMVANNDTSLVCATVDSLVYKKQALAVYITYMRYNLAFDYANGYCRVTVRDLFARRDDGRLEDGERVVDIAPHDTHLYLLEGEHRAERTVYEAECAWLEAYQCLVNERAAGTATYTDDSGCSGGAKVTGLGASAGNFLEWRDVWSAAGGNYELTLRCPTPDARTLDVSVNGGAPVTLRFEPEADGAAAVRTLTVALRPGRNVVRLANTAVWGPDVDVMTLRRL